MKLKTKEIGWFQRLSTRQALMISLVFLFLNTLALPFWIVFYDHYYRKWEEPAFLRQCADHLELIEEGELAMTEESWAFIDSLTTEDRVFLIIWLLVESTLVGLTLAVAIPLLTTRRLTRLADLAARPVTEQEPLPGPFPQQGVDEIARLGATLNAMRKQTLSLLDRLASQDQKRREWVEQVSHDLRTPLMALSACLDRADRMTQSFTDGSNKQEMQKILEVARLDVQRTQILVDDLFEIVRLEEEAPLQWEPVLPAELVRKTVQGLHLLAEEKNIALQIEVAPQLPFLTADGARLTRALENLIRNSLEYADSRVDVSVGSAGESIRFVVADDGPGLPPTIYSPEHDGVPPQSSGWGLKIAHMIATAHGGEFLVEPQLGRGARLSISIPITHPPVSNPHEDLSG